MEVDNVKLNSLLAEDRQKLMSEGRCFRCRQTGHMSKNCPKKKQEDTTWKPEVKNRVTEIIDDREEVSEAETEATAVTKGTTTKAQINNAKVASSQVVKLMNKMTREERNEIMDQMLLEEDEDF